MKKRITTRFKFKDEVIEIDLSKYVFDHFKIFNEYYLLEKEIYTDQKKVLKCISKNRACRFCKRSSLETTFSEETHVVPQLLGRAKIVSKFECDKCNKRFSKFESDLGHYFLLDRVLLTQKKKKGYPTFKNALGSRIGVATDKVKKEKGINQINPKDGQNEEKNLVYIEKESKDDNIIFQNKKIHIKQNKSPYVPLNIFRIFLKIGLSIISEDELTRYSYMFNLLMMDFEIAEKDENKQLSVQLLTREFNVWRNIFPFPILQLYTKKKTNTDNNYADKTLVMFFGNKTYQIPILSDSNFRLKEQNKPIKLILHSPIMNPHMSKKMLKSDEIISIIEESKVQSKNMFRTRIEKEDLEEYLIEE